MSSSTSGADGYTDSTANEQAKKQPAGELIPDRAMMEEVLKRTLDQSAHAIEATERDALLMVVRRHRGEPFEMDPVAVDLVEAMLRSEFKDTASSPNEWQRMCSAIAKTLFDDPVARQRLQSIWTSLCSIEQ